MAFVLMKKKAGINVEQQAFYQIMEHKAGELLGDGYTVTFRPQKKIGMGEVASLLIQKQGKRTAAVLYLPEYYERFQKGEPLDGLVQSLVHAYHMAEGEQVADIRFLHKKEEVEKRLFFRCASLDRNQDILEGIPYREVLNIAIVYGIFVMKEESGYAIISMTEELMEFYGWTEPDLFRMAAGNTRRLFPAKIVPMKEIIAEIAAEHEGNGDSFHFMEETGEAGEHGRELLVVSNRFQKNGFSAVLYTGVLERLSEEKNASLIVIPSSIHEALVIADDGNAEAQKINRMIAEINRTQLEDGEQLSDRAYYYDRKRKGLFLMDEYEKGEYEICVKF